LSANKHVRGGFQIECELRKEDRKESDFLQNIEITKNEFDIQSASQTNTNSNEILANSIKNNEQHYSAGRNLIKENISENKFSIKEGREITRSQSSCHMDLRLIEKSRICDSLKREKSFPYILQRSKSFDVKRSSEKTQISFDCSSLRYYKDLKFVKKLKSKDVKCNKNGKCTNHILFGCQDSSLSKTEQRCVAKTNLSLQVRSSDQNCNNQNKHKNDNNIKIVNNDTRDMDLLAVFDGIENISLTTTTTNQNEIHSHRQSRNSRRPRIKAPGHPNQVKTNLRSFQLIFIRINYIRSKLQIVQTMLFLVFKYHVFLKPERFNTVLVGKGQNRRKWKLKK
jgi:hypothetical protein